MSISHEAVPRHSSRTGTFRLPPRFIGLVLFIAVWELVAAQLPSFVFPSLRLILSHLWNSAVSGEVVAHVLPTLGRLIAGYLIGLVLGGVLGVLMGASKIFESFSKDFILIGLTVPGLIWSVLAAIWFGLSVVGPVFVVTVVAFPFIAVNIAEGVMNIDKQLLDMAAVYSVSRRRVLRRIVLPSVLPFVMASTRYAFAIGWKAVTLTEVYAGSSGVGYMLKINFDHFSVPGVLAWSAVFTALLLVSEYGIMRPIEQRLFHWRPSVTLR